MFRDESSSSIRIIWVMSIFEYLVINMIKYGEYSDIFMLILKIKLF